MARFKYVGSPGFTEEPELEYFGKKFYLGEVTEVTEPSYVTKLERMPAFEKVEDDAEVYEDTPEKAQARREEHPENYPEVESDEDIQKRHDYEQKRQRTKPEADVEAADPDLRKRREAAEKLDKTKKARGKRDVNGDNVDNDQPPPDAANEQATAEGDYGEAAGLSEGVHTKT